MEEILSAYQLAIKMQLEGVRPDEEPWLFAASVARAYAKLHVEAALAAANTNVRLVGRPLNNPRLECTYDVESVTEFNDNTDDYMFTVDSDTILNSYPLTNIV